MEGESQDPPRNLEVIFSVNFVLHWRIHKCEVCYGVATPFEFHKLQFILFDKFMVFQQMSLTMIQLKKIKISQK